MSGFFLCWAIDTFGLFYFLISKFLSMKKKVNLPSKLFLDKEAILTLNEINGGIINYEPYPKLPSPVKSLQVCTYARDGNGCSVITDFTGACSWYGQD